MKTIFTLVLLSLLSKPDLPFKDINVGTSIINDTLSWKVGRGGLIIKRTGSAPHKVNITIASFHQSEWDFSDVSFPDESHGWVVGYKNCGQDKNKGIILYTYDGGIRWIINCSTCLPGMRCTPDSLTPFYLVMMTKIYRQYWGYVLGKDDVLLRWNPIQENWVRMRPHSTALDSLKARYQKVKAKPSSGMS